MPTIICRIPYTRSDDPLVRINKCDFYCLPPKHRSMANDDAYWIGERVREYAFLFKILMIGDSGKDQRGLFTITMSETDSWTGTDVNELGGRD